MSKIVAQVLMKNRITRKIKVDRQDKYFIFNKGLYMIQARFIQLINEEPTLFYFEDVPTPLNRDQLEQGDLYIDDLVMDNLLLQLAPETSGIGLFSGLGGLFDDPRKAVIIILILIVAYSIIAGGGAI